MLYYMAGATFLASKNFKEEEDIYREVRKDPTENSFFTFPLHFFFLEFLWLISAIYPPPPGTDSLLQL